MNKLLIISFFLYTIAAFKTNKKERDEKISKVLEKQIAKRNPSGSKPFNLRENIDYKRKFNYELYISSDGELQQQRFGVNETRQIIKKNVESFRYLVNDMEILFGVYKFNSRDTEKVLRETLKPESVCFMIVGLIINVLNKIDIDDASLYGLQIKGERNGNNVNSTLGISAIFSNITIPLGNFYFPEVKRVPYQVPFLVGYYNSRSGIKHKSFSHICSLPKFLIDVIHTSKDGLKVNFNGNDIDLKELFPATLAYALENSNSLPNLKDDLQKDERTKLLDILRRDASDVPYRRMKDSGIEGEGIEKPADRILATTSFSNARGKVRDFLASSGKSNMDTDSIALYFLSLSQNIYPRTKESESGRITHVKVTNVQKNASGYLSSFKLDLGLENSRVISIVGTVNGKNIYVPKETISSKTITYNVPFSYGLSLNELGLSYGFSGLFFPFNKILPYNLNNLASFVKKN
ncbi:secreted ookinete protein, putative [Plasmodium gallinaceum]|uniref:Secreted ookinete protein, putative n=1 Tax=Plasmodium gallinaceum TaxID=5849 RepID=A0A1J1GLB0_PLAGA|nr:secreted ookinete protein, putative [Plasmodium gallinaceum]CRG93145.1 secreted ookinete protein, putative [Plasmodium gallinaceum]